MFKKTLCFVIIFLTLFSMAALTAYAEESSETVKLSDYLAQNSLPGEEVTANALGQPETINKALSPPVNTDSKWKILKDLNLKLKAFELKDGTAAPGITYSISKDIHKYLLTNSNTTQTGISFSYDIKGNVAFDQRVNPNDFLIANFSFHLFRSSGGVVNAASPDLYDALNNMEDKLVDLDQNALFTSPVFKTFSETLRKNMSNQYYIDFSLIGGLESNQSFTEKESYYGIQLGIDLKAWNPASALARYNIFDWPFAMFRFLSDNDNNLTVLGSAIPTLLIGVDLVDPQSGVVKQIHNEQSAFPRFRAEASFKTPISTKTSSPVFFEATYRYYKEINASETVKQNQRDEFHYLTEAIVLSNGMYVSYTTGKLPLDLKNDKVYEVGFRCKL